MLPTCKLLFSNSKSITVFINRICIAYIYFIEQLKYDKISESTHSLITFPKFYSIINKKYQEL